MGKENWVDIANKKSDGSYPKCGRSGGEKKNYPKCVPAAKAAGMSKSQRTAVARKRKLRLEVEEQIKTNIAKTLASGGLAVRGYGIANR